MQKRTKWTQRMPDDLYDQLKAVADEDGVSINAVINKACRFYLKNEDRPTLERRIKQLEAKIMEFDETKMVLQKLGKIVNTLATPLT